MTMEICLLYFFLMLFVSKKKSINCFYFYIFIMLCEIISTKYMNNLWLCGTFVFICQIECERAFSWI